jgi:hypothetical protein
MSSGENRTEHTHPHEGADTKVLDWREAIQDISALTPGNVVNGFNNLEEVDILTDNVGRWVRGQALPIFVLPAQYLTSRGRWIYEGWSAGARPPSQILKPRFAGQLRDIRLLVLDSNQRSKTISFPGLDVAITADLYSTGRGVLEKAFVYCGIGARALRSGNTRYPGPTTVYYGKLPLHSMDAISAALLGESTRTATEVARDSLWRVILMGSPGSGRR